MPRSALLGLTLAIVAAACTGPTSATTDSSTPAGSPPAGSPPASATSTPSPEPTPPPLVDPKDLISAGVPRDGIPAIDDPEFVSAGQVHDLDPREPVLAVEVKGDPRAYPMRILIWHEIVNDTVGGEPLAVTYCPLCNSALAFRRPTIEGELLDFGTSGRLYHSNLVMYDRQTESLWTQLSGLAVAGPLTGTQLERVPATMVSWGEWLDAHPSGKVLTSDTGYERPYGTNPYEGYEDAESPFLFGEKPDPRLGATEHVLGIVIGEDAAAFPFTALAGNAVDGNALAQALVGSRPVVVFWRAGTASALDTAVIAEGRDVGAATAFDPRVDGEVLDFSATATGFVDEQTGSTWTPAGAATDGPLEGEHLKPVLSLDSLWFSWAAFYPNTRIEG